MTTASRAPADGVLPQWGTVVLAGVDTIHLSADYAISEEVRQKLDAEKELAQLAAKGRTVH